MTNTAKIGVHMLFDHEATLAEYDSIIDGFKAQIDDAAALGVQSIRFGADWRGLQGDGPNTYSEWYKGLVVETVSYAKDKGIDVIMLFGQTPDWAMTEGADTEAAGEGALWQKPADPQDYANAIAELYGTVADAGLSGAVAGWEVWNEPNSVTFWPDAELREDTHVLADTAAAGEYVGLLNAAYDALKLAAQARGLEVTVAGGSLAGADASYLQAMYDLGAKFDVLAIHPYAKANATTEDGYQYAPDAYDPTGDPLSETWSFAPGIANLREVMLANGDTSDVWLTEFGWSSNDSWGGSGSEANQAQHTIDALTLLEDFDFVTMAMLYRLYDKDESGFGLYREDGSLRPVGEALSEHIQSEGDTNSSEQSELESTAEGPAGSEDENVFVIDDSSTNWGWGKTEDGQDVVTWKGAEFHILEAGAKIQFNDKEIDTALWFGDADESGLKFFAGTEFDDFLEGTGSGDFFDLGAGNDHARAFGGSDKLDGGQGNDRLYGGSGNDSLFGQGGSDRLMGGGQDDVLRGGGHNDVLRGENGDDFLFGENGADRLFGGSKNDSLRGGGQADFLFGENGSDRLFGNGGNDVLNGGLGRDIMNGGLGRDRLDYNSVVESRGVLRDRIDGFQRGIDDIDLRTIDANTEVAGNQRFKFIGDDAFSRTAGELHIRKAGTITKVEGDINGDGRVDFTIDVTGAAPLTAVDFFL